MTSLRILGVRRIPAALIAVAAILVSASLRATAQSPRDRTLFVSVVDRNGEPVRGLGVKDFIVREDGAAREVLRVTEATDERDIALLVDDSAAAENVVSHMRDALTRFVEATRRTSDVAIIGLAARPTILNDYTRSETQLKASIGKVFPQSHAGMTLLDALVEVSKGLEKRQTARVAIVAVITEGPELGRFDDRTVVQALKRAGASFHAVTLGTFAAVSPEELRYRSVVLATGTRETGGRHDTVLAGSGLPQALERVGRQLTSEYKVVYSRPDSLIPPEKIDVGVTRPDLSARGTPARNNGGAK